MKKEVAERRAQWLVSLAWSGGDEGLQAGWWTYVNGELEKLEKIIPGVKDRSLSELKRMRESDVKRMQSDEPK